MAPVDEEPPGHDGLEIALHVRNPVRLGDFRDDEGRGSVGRRHERERDVIGRRVEIGADLVEARAVLHLETADASGFGIEILHGGGKRLGPVLVGKGGERGIGGHGAS